MGRDTQGFRKGGLAAFVVVVFGLIALAPAFACSPQANLTLKPSNRVDPGGTVSVVGQTFAATGADAGPVTLRWNGVTGEALATVDADAQGTFQTNVTIPAAVTPGFYLISAVQWVGTAGEVKKPSTAIEVIGAAPAQPATAGTSQPTTESQPTPAPVAATPAPEPAAAPSQPAAVAPPATRTAPAPARAAAAPAAAPAAPAAPAAAPAPVTPVPAPVVETPAAPVVDPATPVVSPDVVTADLWSGFGATRGPLGRSTDTVTAPAPSSGSNALAVWLVVAGVAILATGTVGLVRRRPVPVTEPPAAD
jgi:hypothetical protein